MVRESESNKTTHSLKFLCSYGGKILPRSTDGNLRYVGGLTRVLSVDRSISFAELMVKLGEFCGYSVTLRCQLPNGDLETLISIKSEEDLANLIEEYDKASPDSKIRAILSPPKSLKQVSPLSSTNSSVNSSATKQSSSTDSPMAYRYVHRSSSPPARFSVIQRGYDKSCYHQYYHAQGNHTQENHRSSYYATPHSNYWN